MDAVKPEALAARLQWEAQDYWVHIEASSPLEKYPAKQHARLVAQELDVNDGLIYLPGARTVLLEDSDQPRPFRQRRYFYYLSGVDEPDCDLTYDIKRDELTLYIPPINPNQIIWSGRGSTIAEAYDKYDVDTVLYSTTISGSVGKWAKHSAGYIYILHPSQAVWDGDKMSDRVNHISLQRAMDRCRVTKDPHEIKLIKKANEITAKAHRKVLENVKNFKNEAQVEAIFLDTCVAEDAKRQAYEIIAASGENASTLHYVKNDEPLKGRQLMCLDAGCEWQNYASDVTRTFPLSGSWPSKEAKEIYDLVQTMQTTCIEQLKPGVRFWDLHVLAHRIAVVGLLKLGILHNGTVEEILNAGTSLAFFPHGLGHYMGLEVHDGSGVPVNGATAALESNNGIDYHVLVDPTTCKAPVDRYSGGLQDGMVVTVEPGIYFSDYALSHMYLPKPEHSKYINKEALARYMPVGGVRIEDDILITAKGFENLTTAPKGEEMLRIIRGEDEESSGRVQDASFAAQPPAIPQLVGQPISSCSLRPSSPKPTEQMSSKGMIDTQDRGQADSSPRSCGDQPSPGRRRVTVTCGACRIRRVRCQQVGRVKDGPYLTCSGLGRECSHPYTGKDCPTSVAPQTIRQACGEGQSGNPDPRTDNLTTVMSGSPDTRISSEVAGPIEQHPYWTRFARAKPAPAGGSSFLLDRPTTMEMSLSTYPPLSASQDRLLPSMGCLSSPVTSEVPPQVPKKTPLVPQKPLAYRHSLPCLTRRPPNGWCPMAEASKPIKNSQTSFKYLKRRSRSREATSSVLPLWSTALPDVPERVSNSVPSDQSTSAGQLGQNTSTGAQTYENRSLDYQRQLRLLEEQCKKCLWVKPMPSGQANSSSVVNSQNDSIFAQEHQTYSALLEAQNKKRLLMASLEEDRLDAPGAAAEGATTAKPHPSVRETNPETQATQMENQIESFLNPATDATFEQHDDVAKIPQEVPAQPSLQQKQGLQPSAEPPPAITQHQDHEAARKHAPNATHSTLRYTRTKFLAGIEIQALRNDPSWVANPPPFNAFMCRILKKHLNFQRPEMRIPLAAGAATYLSTDPHNRAKGVTGDEICRLLDTEPTFFKLCDELEGLGLVFERTGLAAALLDATPDWPHPGFTVPSA